MCHFLPVHHLGIAFLGRVEGQNITQGDEGRRYRLMDCYIDLFLTHFVVPYSEPHVFAAPIRGSQRGCAVGHCPSRMAPRVASALTWLFVPTGWLWVTVWRGYLFIYNFIASTHSFGWWFTWSVPTNQPTSCFPVYSAGASGPRNPLLTALSKINMQHSLFVCLFVCVLWYINICRLFNAKSILYK